MIPKVGDVVFVHLRYEDFKEHVVVVNVRETEYGLPVRVLSKKPIEYFNGQPLYTFSVALNEIVEVSE